MSKTTIDRLPPADRVHDIIRRNMIGDGFSIVFDLERSEGSWIIDAAKLRVLTSTDGLVQ